MINARIQEMLSDLNLEIDDIRWYLSYLTSKELLSYQSKGDALCQEVWSGRLADRLHDMEDRFLADLGRRLEDGSGDESSIISILQEAKTCQRRRRR